MKTKNIVLTVAGGILGTGAAIFSCCEIQRLKKIISHKEEAVEGYKKVIEANDDVKKKQQSYIESLERLVEQDKKVIACQKEQIANLQKMHETLKPDSTTTSLPQRASGNLMPPKKEKQSNREYIFQYDSNLKLVGKYDSVTDACSKVGLKAETSITRVMNGKSRTAAGYFWSRGMQPLKKFPDIWIELSQKMQKGK